MGKVEKCPGGVPLNSGVIDSSQSQQRWYCSILYYLNLVGFWWYVVLRGQWGEKGMEGGRGENKREESAIMCMEN